MSSDEYSDDVYSDDAFESEDEASNVAPVAAARAPAAARSRTPVGTATLRSERGNLFAMQEKATARRVHSASATTTTNTLVSAASQTSLVTMVNTGAACDYFSLGSTEAAAGPGLEAVCFWAKGNYKGRKDDGASREAWSAATHALPPIAWLGSDSTGRRVVALHDCAGESGAAFADSWSLAPKGLLSVWDGALGAPAAVLLSAAECTCAVLGPCDRTRLAVAGCRDGSLQVWKLLVPTAAASESSSAAASKKPSAVVCQPLCARGDTHSMLQCHTSAIVSIAEVSVVAQLGSRPILRVVTLDDRGEVSFWKLTDASNETSSIDVTLEQAIPKALPGPGPAYHTLAVSPVHPHEVFVSGCNGLSTLRSGVFAVKEAGNPVYAWLRFPAGRGDVFLAATAAGRVTLFTTAARAVVATWDVSCYAKAHAFSCVVSVEWSRHDPDLFYVLTPKTLYQFSASPTGPQVPTVLRQTVGAPMTGMTQQDFPPRVVVSSRDGVAVHGVAGVGQ